MIEPRDTERLEGMPRGAERLEGMPRGAEGFGRMPRGFKKGSEAPNTKNCSREKVEGRKRRERMSI